MAIFVAKSGEKIDYKDTLKWYEFKVIGKKIAAAKTDPMAANDALVAACVTKITTPDGAEHTEEMAILKAFDNLESSDAMRVIKALTKLVQDDDDPKETSSD